MKTKLIGLGILAVVILAAIAYAVFGAGQRVTEIHGYGRRGGGGYPAGPV